MAFSESLKKQVRELSNCCCIFCGEHFVEVHHILPQKDGGSDEFDNAVALCPNCHLRYGNNPDLRKQIKEKRDLVYKRNNVENIIGQASNKGKVFKTKKTKSIAIYHIVFKEENFSDAAKDIHNLIKKAIKENPDSQRVLYLDIEGHRDPQGGFDKDMFELQCEFLTGNMMAYLTELHMPLATIKNPDKQRNDIMEDLLIIEDTKEFQKISGLDLEEGKLFKLSSINVLNDKK